MQRFASGRARAHDPPHHGRPRRSRSWPMATGLALPSWPKSQPRPHHRTLAFSSAAPIKESVFLHFRPEPVGARRGGRRAASSLAIAAAVIMVRRKGRDRCVGFLGVAAIAVQMRRKDCERRLHSPPFRAAFPLPGDCRKGRSALSVFASPRHPPEATCRAPGTGIRAAEIRTRPRARRRPRADSDSFRPGIPT